MGPIFCPVYGKEVPTHKLVYDFQERKVVVYRCVCGFIYAAGLDPEDLARMGWMEGYKQQCREMRARRTWKIRLVRSRSGRTVG